MGGNNPSNSDIIQYITITTLGNSIDFGNLSENKVGGAACASATRGIFAGTGEAPADTDTIDYITIASTGNATDFGDLTALAGNGPGGCSDVHGGIGE